MQNTMSQRGELGELVGDLRAVLRQRLGLGRVRFQTSDVGAALGEAPGHLVAHAPGADPADCQFLFLLIVNRDWRSAVPAPDTAK